MNIAGQFGLDAFITIRLPIQCPQLKFIVRVINVYCASGTLFTPIAVDNFSHIYIAFMVFYPARFLYNLMSVLFMPFLALMSLSLYFSFSMTCHGTSEKQRSNWYLSDDLVLDLPRICAVILNNQWQRAPCFSLVCCLQSSKGEIISVSLFFSCSRKKCVSCV